MLKLKIDKELQKLIVPLKDEERSLLEENLIKEGCRDAIVIWNQTIVDGHNRFNICTENNIPFKTKNIEFKNREEAKEWIIRNQLGRRNLAPYQRLELAEKLEASIKARAKDNQMMSGKCFGKGSVISPKPIEKIDTRKELAKIAGVGESSVRLFKVIQEEGTEEQKERLRNRESTINAVYGEIEQAKIPQKTCKHCNRTMETDKFLPCKNICRECDNRIRRKPTTVEQPQEKPKKEKLKEYVSDLYDLSVVPEYTMNHVLIEIEGSRENLIYIVDNCLEQRDELIHKADNVAIFNNKINQIINELKERLINDEGTKNS